MIIFLRGPDANEHEPVHVQGKCEGREGRAEVIMIDGEIAEIRFSPMAGRSPLRHREMQYFQEIVNARATNIVQKWIDFFVLHKAVRPERITRRLK